MTKPMDALVTDVQHRAVVAGLRGLGRGGVRVGALAPRRGAPGLWSRYAKGRYVEPNPATDPAGYANAISHLAAAHGPLVVYPGTEDAIEALIGVWADLPQEAVVPYPGVEALAAVRDKPGIPALAEAAGLRAPRTHAVATLDELAHSDLETPCIVKSARPAGRLRQAHAVESGEQLRGLIAAGTLPAAEPLLVQDWARGRLVSVELVIARDGALVARFQQLTERTSPTAAGSISVARSVEPDEELIARAAQLLREAGYWGLAQLDLVESEHGLVLVDVNPRFYSCLPLALACGVNLPFTWHQVALGRPAPGISRYPTGVTFRWLEGELVAAARGEPRRLLDRPGPRAAGAMWARDDPAPSVLMAAEAVTGWLGRLIGGRS